MLFQHRRNHRRYRRGAGWSSSSTTRTGRERGRPGDGRVQGHRPGHQLHEPARPRGLICLTVTPEHCRRLRLPADGGRHQCPAQHQFHGFPSRRAEGVTTGDIRARPGPYHYGSRPPPGARPEDLRQPGHVFPGHGPAPAACSAARATPRRAATWRGWAGLPPSAAIVEILNADGSMAPPAPPGEIRRRAGV